jgi:hypothetical protein
MSGQSKVGKVSSKPFADCMMPVYSLHREAIGGASCKQTALQEFYHRNKEHLDEVSQKGYFSFHTPVEYGGLGMYEGENDTVTLTQRQIGRKCLLDATNGVQLRRPECLDDKKMPYFTCRPVHGPLVVKFGSTYRTEYPEIRAPQLLTPYIDNMFGDIDPDGESRCCTARNLIKYYRNALRGRSVRPIRRNMILRGYRLLRQPLELINKWDCPGEKRDLSDFKMKNLRFSSSTPGDYDGRLPEGSDDDSDSDSDSYPIAADHGLMDSPSSVKYRSPVVGDFDDDEDGLELDRTIARMTGKAFVLRPEYNRQMTEAEIRADEEDYANAGQNILDKENRALDIAQQREF